MLKAPHFHNSRRPYVVNTRALPPITPYTTTTITHSIPTPQRPHAGSSPAATGASPTTGSDTTGSPAPTGEEPGGQTPTGEEPGGQSPTGEEPGGQTDTGSPMPPPTGEDAPTPPPSSPTDDSSPEPPPETTPEEDSPPPPPVTELPAEDEGACCAAACNAHVRSWSCRAGVSASEGPMPCKHLALCCVAWAHLLLAGKCMLLAAIGLMSHAADLACSEAAVYAFFVSSCAHCARTIGRPCLP